MEVQFRVNGVTKRTAFGFLDESASYFQEISKHWIIKQTLDDAFERTWKDNIIQYLQGFDL